MFQVPGTHANIYLWVLNGPPQGPENIQNLQNGFFKVRDIDTQINHEKINSKEILVRS